MVEALKYDEAEERCTQVAERWIEARAGGRLSTELNAEFDRAQQELRRAKRRLEKADRQLAKERS